MDPDAVAASASVEGAPGDGQGDRAEDRRHRHGKHGKEHRHRHKHKRRGHEKGEEPHWSPGEPEEEEEGQLPSAHASQSLHADRWVPWAGGGCSRGSGVCFCTPVWMYMQRQGVSCCLSAPTERGARTPRRRPAKKLRPGDAGLQAEAGARPDKSPPFLGRYGAVRSLHPGWEGRAGVGFLRYGEGPALGQVSEAGGPLRAVAVCPLDPFGPSHFPACSEQVGGWQCAEGARWPPRRRWPVRKPGAWLWSPAGGLGSLAGPTPGLAIAWRSQRPALQGRRLGPA